MDGNASVAERITAAYNAGFRNTAAVESLSIIVALSLVDCPLGEGCLNYYNENWTGHPVTLCPPLALPFSYESSCLTTDVDPFPFAWQVSGGGHNFGFWVAFGTATFYSLLQPVRDVIASMAPPIGPPLPQPTPTPASSGIAPGIGSPCPGGSGIVTKSGTTSASGCTYTCSDGQTYPCGGPITPAAPGSSHTLGVVLLAGGAVGIVAYALSRRQPAPAPVPAQ